MTLAPFIDQESCPVQGSSANNGPESAAAEHDGPAVRGGARHPCRGPADLMEKQSQVDRFETALQNRSLPHDERAQIEDAVKGARQELARPLAEVRRLSAEEASFANDLNAEQARWSDFNQRLEELEAALIRRQSVERVGRSSVVRV